MAESVVVGIFRSFPYKDLSGNQLPKDSYAYRPSAQPRSGDKTKPPPAPAGAQKPQTKKSASSSQTVPPSPSTAATSNSHAMESSKAGQAPARVEKAEHVCLQEQLKTNDQGKQIPFSNNGGVTDRYYWSQNLEELTIYYTLPEDSVTARDVECHIGVSKLRLSVRGKTLLDGTYPDPEKVKPSESTWSLERSSKPQSGTTLVITLDKSRETWWPNILQGEPEIDTTKVDSSKRIDEFDEETQAHIQKIMFDQRQKAHGLPTSDELMQADILEKAKTLPGSPFLQENK